MELTGEHLAVNPRPQHRSSEWRGMPPHSPKDGTVSHALLGRDVVGNRTAAVLPVLVTDHTHHAHHTATGFPARSPVSIAAIGQFGEGDQGAQLFGCAPCPLGRSQSCLEVSHAKLGMSGFTERRRNISHVWNIP